MNSLLKDERRLYGRKIQIELMNGLDNKERKFNSG